MTIERFGYGMRGVGGALSAVTALALLATSAAAQQSAGKWLPFLGCWEADAPTDAPVRPGAVCMSAQDATGVEAITVITVTDGQVTARRTLIADGQPRDVTEAGCSGWESARWSEDGQRVYLRSEMMCEGGTKRVTSGVLAMVSPTEWVDVQAVESGGFPAVRAVKYRAADEAVAAASGVQVPSGLSLAVETARAAASQPLSVDDVKEASSALSTEALEMFLFERGGIFELNADALVALADAGVPDRVIDLVVALAYPTVFNVNSEARMVGLRPEDADTQPREGQADRRVYGTFYDPFGYRYDRYGYGYGYGSYSPFGWGGPWRYSQGPVIIIQPPSDGEDGGDPRLVKGRGYTRGSRGATPSTDRVSSPDMSTDRRSSGSSSPSSASGSSRGSSGGDTGRTAKKRGGG